ncbi:hypothetical protein THZB04_70176 [Vibrio owensii]|nr:hypothetical protein THZB04_70176 [Vibrio owensii]
MVFLLTIKAPLFIVIAVQMVSKCLSYGQYLYFYQCIFKFSDASVER